MGFNAEFVSHRPDQRLRYAEYAAYVFLSPIVGLVRLVVAVAGLIGDKYQKSAIENNIELQVDRRRGTALYDSGGRELVRETILNRQLPMIEEQLLMIEERMARNWQQLARALSELVVLGSFFYAFTEAGEPNVPVIQHHHMRAIALENKLRLELSRSSSTSRMPELEELE